MRNELAALRSAQSARLLEWARISHCATDRLNRCFGDSRPCVRMKNRASIVGFRFRRSFLPCRRNQFSASRRYSTNNGLRLTERSRVGTAVRKSFSLYARTGQCPLPSLPLARCRLLDEWCRGLGARFRLESKHRREPFPNRLSHKEGQVDPCAGDGSGDGQAQTGPVVTFN